MSEKTTIVNEVILGQGYFMPRDGKVAKREFEGACKLKIEHQITSDLDNRQLETSCDPNRANQSRSYPKLAQFCGRQLARLHVPW